MKIDLLNLGTTRNHPSEFYDLGPKEKGKKKGPNELLRLG